MVTMGVLHSYSVVTDMFKKNDMGGDTKISKDLEFFQIHRKHSKITEITETNGNQSLEGALCQFYT